MVTARRILTVLNASRFRVVTLVAISALTGAILHSEARQQTTAAPGGGGQSHELSVLPPIPDSRDRVYDMAVVQQLYEFVARHGDIARHLPCFCSCGDKLQHQSVEQCYISKRAPDGTVTWSPHGMECSICMNVVRVAKRTYEAGGSVQEIRAAVEKEYEGVARRTNTPWPQKSHH